MEEDFSRVMASKNAEYSVQWQVYAKKTVWYFPGKILSLSKGIFEVNFGHIIHLQTSQRIFTVVSFQEKLHLRHFSKLKIIIKMLFKLIKGHI